MTRQELRKFEKVATAASRVASIADDLVRIERMLASEAVRDAKTAKDSRALREQRKAQKTSHTEWEKWETWESAMSLRNDEDAEDRAQLTAGRLKAAEKIQEEARKAVRQLWSAIFELQNTHKATGK